MSAVRSHRYTVAAPDLDEFLGRRSSLIASIRTAHPGLTRTVLIQLEDGSYSDTWYWESPAQMGAAFAAMPNFPLAPLTMALTSDGTAMNGHVVDER